MRNQLSGIALILFGILFEVAAIPAEALNMYFITLVFFVLGLILGVCGIVVVFRKPDDEGK